jgi:site-specific DNA recombinase
LPNNTQHPARTDSLRLRSYLHTVLNNRVYLGFFEWSGIEYRGKHQPIISPELFAAAQAVMHAPNKGKYNKHRCSGYRGKCELPRFREEQISEMLAEVMNGIHIPDDVLFRIESTLESDQLKIRNEVTSQRARLKERLEAVRRRIDQAYADKLDGKIDESFWQRKRADWQREEQELETAIAGTNAEKSADRLLDVKRILELANKAYFLYLTRKPMEQAELLRKVLLNCSIDAVSVSPTYRKPFDMIFEKAKRKEWSGWADLNCRPLAPQASALPG